MEKIRINDLARELEVKSKEILDTLPKVGVTEKKTHSSSITEEEAVKVRAALKGHGEGAHAKAEKRAHVPAEPEIKTKFDLSKITRPGDVLKAITHHDEPAPHPPAKAAPPAPPKAAAPAAKAPAAKAPAAPAKPAAPPKVAEPVAAEPAAPAEPPRRVIRPIPSQGARIVAPPAPPAEPPAVVEKAEPKHAVHAAPPPPPAPAAPAEAAPPAAAAPPAPPHAPAKATVRPGQPIAQQPRRVIVPQTGPRPVYLASARPPGQPSAFAGTPRPLERGKPIFQRPRPSAPGAGPGMRTSPGGPASARRGPHPTTPRPGGGGFAPRPGGPGMAPPPPGRPTGRAAPNRRPGQRYEPRGVKEGPMKGFVPPPRLMATNEPLPITRTITITEAVTVKDLAEKLEIRAKDLIARLLAKGVFATINQTLDVDLAKDLARQFGADTSIVSYEEQAQQEVLEQAMESGDESALATSTRAPVVTIMGHVDHGKTSLLDAIRETNVAGGEAGGITQHIGAYKVRINDANSPAFGREIVFLDTPGHEAFTRMRARGAKVTDIVVLVVAADDGVMPQTLEAIDHAQAAKVPLIVAVNKVDKPDALPDRVKKQLADRGLMPENWGGSTVFVDVSAKQKTNLNLLLEMVCLVADLQDLKASPERPATATVLEAKLDRGRGPVATILIQNGTLKVGDTFVVGNIFGKVRAMFDDRGGPLTSAGPSTPVEILGLEGLPASGDQLVVASDREKAKHLADFRSQRAREAQLAKSSKVSLEGLAEQLKTAGQKELAVILKADVHGSVEVLSDLLGRLSTEKVKLKLLHASVGAITETDVLLASASNAIIIGFSVRPERKAQEIAEQEGVDIRLHSIIYELQDELKKAMLGLLEPVIKETYQGRAEVRETFRIPKVGNIAGCYIVDGHIKRDNDVRLLRDNVVVFTGKIGSLRRFKDDVSDVRNGMECGIAIANYGDVKIGDVIEAYVTERIAADVLV